MVNGAGGGVLYSRRHDSAVSRRRGRGRGVNAITPPFLVTIALVLICLVSTGCVQHASGEQDPPPTPEPRRQASAPQIETDQERPPQAAGAMPTAVAVPINSEDVPRTVSVDTSLVVDQDVMVMARMGGMVEKIFVDRGSRVKKRDPLLRLRNRDLKLLLQKAEIVARQRVADFERFRELYEEKTVSAAQFEESELAMESARVDVEIAREELGKSIVRAPFSGVVIDRFAKVGQKVIEDENVPLFQVTALSPLLARLYLTEDVARSLHAGDPVKVRPRYLPSAGVEGTIDWVSGVVDASSGTCQAIISVPGGGGKGPLSPGTAVTILLSLPATSAGVLIPRAALDGEEDRPGAHDARVRVLENGRGTWRRVRVGRDRGDRVEILNGLRPGERVVLRGRDEDGNTGSR